MMPLSSRAQFEMVSSAWSSPRSMDTRSSSVTSMPSLYHITLGSGFARKGTLMFAVWPAFTVTGCAASASRTDGSMVGGSAGRGGREGSKSRDAGGAEGWRRSPCGMGEELGVGGRARRGLALSIVVSDLTCNKYRGFALCTLGPECVLALVLWPHIGKDELVYRTLLHDLHAGQVRDLRGEGRS